MPAYRHALLVPLLILIRATDNKPTMLPRVQPEIETTEGGITYRLLNLDSAEEIQAVIAMHFDVFFKDEPVSRVSSYTYMIHSEENVKAIEAFLRKETTTSIVALDSQSEELVAFFNTYVLRRTDTKLPISILPNPDPTSELIVKMFHLLVGPDLLFGKYPDADSILTTQKMAVKNDYRNRGIGSKLFDIGIEVGRRRNCDLISLFSTSDISAHMCERRGFELTRFITWNELLLEDGRAPFEDVRSAGAKGYVKKVDKEEKS